MSIENLKTIDSFADADAAGDPGPDQGSGEINSPLNANGSSSPTANLKSTKSAKAAPGGTQIENLKVFGEETSPVFMTDSRRQSKINRTFDLDPFAEADEEPGDQKAAEYIHIRIQQRNGRKTLTTVQGLPKKFDQKKILKVIKKKFACNGTIVNDIIMGDVIQLQGDQRKDVQEFLTGKDGLELEVKTIKVHGF
ncbi:translation initiation factor 3 [Sclerotinia borealis F-4128]|uniref:Translation initiation factor 3 n=1 Tax=Sclerotinia borealis (strain F-4128) TaxID=1432307 RepID=W9C4A6_SCLBF|nr:translation initiation factor 3 [Sclerotinia borealis F-4128]